MNQKPEISARKNPHNIFLKMKTTKPRILHPAKISFHVKGMPRHSQVKENQGTGQQTNFPKEDGWRKFSKQKGKDKRKNSGISACCQAGDFINQTSPKRMARGNSLNRKEMIKGRILEYQLVVKHGIFVDTNAYSRLFVL